MHARRANFATRARRPNNPDAPRAGKPSVNMLKYPTLGREVTHEELDALRQHVEAYHATAEQLSGWEIDPLSPNEQMYRASILGDTSYDSEERDFAGLRRRYQLFRSVTKDIIAGR